MSSRSTHFRNALLGASAIVSVVSLATPAGARAQQVAFDMPAQPLTAALKSFGATADQQLIYSERLVEGRTAPALKGDYAPDQALTMLLAGSGLVAERTPGGVVTIRSADQGPQPGSAAGGSGAEVEALIVTAQKREEDIQDVPIAISAFTQEDLERSQVAGGPDLMTQVPNMTFTKTNFTSYSIQLRGIGTQAISATVDPAVAVAFNNTPFLRAHFFEQEFYDLERVEVLRGPQGTLYGRNATAGVVNLISAKPKFDFAAKVSGDLSNYNSSRLEGMINLPLVEDKAALRLAGAWTKREGYSTNQLTGTPIDGRDLWSTRVSLRVDPTERLSANFIWEHFEEDDDRLRSGKQTCKRAENPETVMGVPTDVFGNGVLSAQRYLNQGCLPASVYSPEAFQTPHGGTLPFYLPLGELGAPIAANGDLSYWDIYASTAQSRDLRVIESQVDSSYRASSDTLELNVDYNLTENLTLTSQTGYNRDFLFSTQDYNRFNTKPGAFAYCEPDDPACGSGSGNRNYRLSPSPVGKVFGAGSGDLFGTPCIDNPLNLRCYTPGIFCDPQIGCSDRLVLMDLATARSRQFSQEFRVSSDFEGRFNFSLGANYLRYKTLEDYYVFINSLTLVAIGEGRAFYGEPFPIYVPGVTDNSACLRHGFDYVVPEIWSNPQDQLCPYVDPNPITDLNGQGHNYFRNQNPYKVQSYAVFGEAYYDVTENLKLTAGLRWTVDGKQFESIPSQLLVTGYGYPTIAHIEQEWREPTGRLVATWMPDLAFTDETMVYGSYTHGYKAGGANPPGAVLLVNRGGDIPVPTHPEAFDAEFLDAFELGTKNTLLDGELTLNLTGFYYDYQDYQISQIVDRSAINLNFDAEIWGVELETDWRPLENLRFGLKVGYEDTRVADGESAVDLMDRANSGRPDENGVTWMVIKPFPTQASNCVLPEYVVAAILIQEEAGEGRGLQQACTNTYLGLPTVGLVDPVTSAPYEANPEFTADGLPVPEGYIGFNPLTAPNGGAGFSQDLSGNALPNAPHWTTTLTADYTVPLPSDWLMTLHTDLYYQSEAWTRIFNMEGFDKLKAYTNVNVAAIFSNEDRGWTVMAYVKNVFDKDNITGAFLNSDDTGLTNNVFVNEPRLYGLRVTKNWDGSPWWGAAGPAWKAPFRIELEGYHAGMGGGNSTYLPGLNLTPEGEDLFPSDLEFPTGIQNDLAASNGGGVRLTYQPEGSSWNVSAGVRYGRAGGGTHRFKAIDVNETCVINGKYCRDPSGVPTDPAVNPLTKYGWHSSYETTTENEEVHSFVDFMVGKEFGLGSLMGRPAKSTLSAGLIFARFKSNSEAIMHGSPDVYFPETMIVYVAGSGYQFIETHEYRFNDRLQSARELEGWGPQVNWETAVRLLGTDDNALDVDVGLGGMLLYGKQKTAVSGHIQGSYYYGLLAPVYIDHLYNQPLDIAPRSANVTVPGVRANLGLSYSTGGLKLSGGYRWERYEDVIDGGIEERRTFNRTFDGPYFKVSFGFGG